MDNIMVLCALVCAIPAMMLFTYMFDDKADHGKNGFTKYILKEILDVIFGGTSKEEKKPEEKPEEATPPSEEKKA